MKACPALLILAIVITAIVADAEAVEATLTWTAPTTYTNGEPLPPEHIAGYHAVSDTGDEHIVTGLSATFTVDPGVRCFIVRTNATNGLSSNYAFLCKDIPGDGPPGEPVYVCP